MPQTVALDTNQSYEWYLLVQCDLANAERFVFVNGAIRRLDRPDLQILACCKPEEMLVPFDARFPQSSESASRCL